MRLDPTGLERYCERCSKSVHDLSAMGPERARALLAGARGPICISYASDHRGELVFDPPRRPTPRTDFVPLARLAQAATLVASLGACTPHGEETPLQIQDPVANMEAIEQPAPVVIPTRPPEPVKPPTPEVEEPCEPEVEPVPGPDRIKGKFKPTKTRGTYVPIHDDPLF